MAYSEILVARVRKALAHLPRVEEKRMFGGIAFMVNGKMCITAGKDRLMFRIDPEIHDQVVKKTGARTMTMKGREYKGYIQVSEEGLKASKDFEFWVAAALDYNKKAKASKKKK